MNDKLDLNLAVAFLVAGSIFGGFATYQHMDTRIDRLDSRISDLKQSKAIDSYNLSGDEKSLAKLFESVDQSVVSIQSGESGGEGSGFVYSSDGYIVTNHHVIEDASNVQVQFTDGETLNARIVGQDAYSDLAVLKVTRNDLEPLTLGNSSEVRPGQTAIAVGNPFGLSGTMTRGIVSAKNRLLRVEGGFSIPNVIQTDAAINPGNSGGPVFNGRGEVIGVSTAIRSNTRTFSGIGFAIPSNTVKRVVPELIQQGDYDHSWLGVRGVSVNAAIAERAGLENSTGFLVFEAVEEGPAAEAGIRSGDEEVLINGRQTTLGGDVIVAVDGQEMRGIEDILNYLEQETEPGETVNVTVVRNGERATLPVNLESRPND